MLKTKIVLSVMASLLVVGCGGSGHAPKASSTPPPNLSSKSFKIIDGYACEGNKVVAKIGDKSYSPEVTKEGGITLKGIKAASLINTLIEVSNIKIDANNNGKRCEASDKDLDFSMSAPADSYLITQLTTLLVKMEADGKKVDPEFKKMLLEFNPVEAPARLVSNPSERMKLKNLLLLSEILKVAMVSEGGLESLSNLNLTKSFVSEPFNIGSLITGLPDSIKAKAKAKVETIGAVLDLLPAMDSNKIDFNTLMVNLSDGETSLKDGMVIAIKAKDKTDKEGEDLGALIAYVIDSEKYSTDTVKNVTENLLAIESNIKAISEENFENLTSIKEIVLEIKDTTTIIADPVDDVIEESKAKADLSNAKINFGEDNVSITPLDANNHFVATLTGKHDVADFSDINISSFSFDKNFKDASTDLEITIIDDNNASNIETLIVKITGVKVDNEAGKELTTIVPVGSKVVTSKTNNNGTVKHSKTNKKERKQVGLEVHLTDLVDDTNEKENDYLDKLQAYLDATGKTYKYKMTVSSDMFETIDVTGDIKTQ